MARPKTARFSSEDHILGMLRSRSAGPGPRPTVGIGDDAAVILPRGAEEYWVLTTDLLLEHVDFERKWLSPAELGHKALAVNLSDVAAMGARPRFYCVALGLPEDVEPDWIRRFYDGMQRLARRNRASLVGGDLSRSRDIHVSLSVLGESSKRKILRRSGGKAGDLLYVTGILGQASAGLKLLQQGLGVSGRGRRAALRAHRAPVPRCEVGLWLAGHGYARAMIDLSDGLSTDLHRLCSASRTGAEVHGDRLPVFRAARAWGMDPLSAALHGGEDFELLFAVPSNRAARMERHYPSRFPKISRIGCLTRAGEIVLVRDAGRLRLPAGGFDHFQAQQAIHTRSSPPASP